MTADEKKIEQKKNHYSPGTEREMFITAFERTEREMYITVLEQFITAWNRVHHCSGKCKAKKLKTDILTRLLGHHPTRQTQVNNNLELFSKRSNHSAIGRTSVILASLLRRPPNKTNSVPDGTGVRTVVSVRCTSHHGDTPKLLLLQWDMDSRMWSCNRIGKIPRKYELVKWEGRSITSCLAGPRMLANTKRNLVPWRCKTVFPQGLCWVLWCSSVSYVKQVRTQITASCHHLQIALEQE